MYKPLLAVAVLMVGAVSSFGQKSLNLWPNGAPGAQPNPPAEVDLNGDRLTEYLNPTSSVFFAPVPSADLVLAR